MASATHAAPPRRLALASAGVALLATPMCTAIQLWTAPIKLHAEAQHNPYQGMDMRCVGEDAVHRACLMRDLYYDTATKTFLFFGRNIEPDFVDEDDEELKRRFDELTCAPRSSVQMRPHRLTVLRLSAF